MFIGSNYVLTDSAEGRTSLGWLQIKVMERVLSHVVSRPRSDTTVRSYHYTLMCLVDGGDSAEIDDEQLHCEVIAGLYEYDGSK